jgi:hypothetical protein
LYPLRSRVQVAESDNNRRYLADEHRFSHQQQGKAQRYVEPDELTQERIARNDARFREANEDIEAAAVSHDLTEMRVPFICECADTGCTAIIRLSLGEYEEVRADSTTFINSPGHVAAARGAAEVVAERERYEIVRKLGHAAEVVERMDPRRDSDEEAVS